MNIGETDADGWTYVRFGDAAKAAQDGTHEYQGSAGHGWDSGVGFYDLPYWQYRLREKARTITVTIPRPFVVDNGALSTRIILDFEKLSYRDQAATVIRSAMEQS